MQMLQYIHVRDDNHVPFATLCIDRHNDSVGVSFCHPGDQFNKAMGRQIAHGRALSHRTIKDMPEVNRFVKFRGMNTPVGAAVTVRYYYAQLKHKQDLEKSGV